MFLNFLKVCESTAHIAEHRVEWTGGVFNDFSRMRSEGFPFIVGVWGWTCVRVVLLCRRRVVVVSSSCRR